MSVNQFQSTRRRSSKNSSSNSSTSSSNSSSNPFVSTAIGFVLIIGSIYLIFHTERTYIQAKNEITDIQRKWRTEQDFHQIHEKYKNVDPALMIRDDGYPYFIVHELHTDVGSRRRGGGHGGHFIADSDTTGITFDAEFTQSEILCVEKTIEMYQWTEHKKEEKRKRRRRRRNNDDHNNDHHHRDRGRGRGREEGERYDQDFDDEGEEEVVVVTYDYKPQWKQTFVDSSGFKHSENHRNPHPSHSVNANELGVTHLWTPAQLMLSQFYLNIHQSPAMKTKLLKEINANQYWTNVNRKVLDKIQYNNHNGNHNGNHRQRRHWKMQGGYIYVPHVHGNRDTDANMNANAHHNVGDIRITYKAFENGDGRTMTFLGSINNAREMETYSVGGKSSGNRYLFLEFGRHSITDVIHSFRDENNTHLYLLRLASFVVMCIGFVALGSLLHFVLSYIPFGVGSCLSCGLVAVSVVCAVVLWVLFFCVAYVISRVEIVIAFVVLVMTGLWYVSNHKNDNGNNSDDNSNADVHSDNRPEGQQR